MKMSKFIYFLKAMTSKLKNFAVFSLLGLLLILELHIIPASIAQPSQSGDYNSFVEWCKNSKSLEEDTQKTINLLLEEAGVTDCIEADKRLSKLTDFSSVSFQMPDRETDLKVLATLPNIKKLKLGNISNLNSIVYLKNLIELNLYQIYTTDFKPLGSLKNLTTLELGYLDASSKMPDLSPLSLLKELTVLKLTWSQGDKQPNLSFLATLPNLRELTIGWGEGTKNIDLSSISSLKNLKKLTLEFDRVDGDVSLKPLRSLSNLTELELSIRNFNDKLDLKSLASLPNLKSFHLSAEYSNFPTSGLSALTQISELSLFGIKDLSFLKAITNVIKLDLSTENTDINALAFLSNLVELKLDNNQNIKNWSALASLKKLTKLNLSNTQISDISILSSLNNLHELNLGSNQIRNIAPLAGLENLVTLDLSANQINDIQALKRLERLSELNLSSNQIRDISALSNLKELMKLNISANKVVDISPLQSLNKLAFVSIEGNPLSLQNCQVGRIDVCKTNDVISKAQTQKDPSENEFKALESQLIAYRKVGDRLREGVTLNRIGEFYSEHSQYQQALQFLKQGLAIFKEINSFSEERDTLVSLGLVYSYLGQKEIATQSFERSLELAKQVGSVRGSASSLTNTARVYYDQGDYQRALDFLKQAWTGYAFMTELKPVATHPVSNDTLMHEIPGDEDGVAIFNLAGQIYGKLGDKEKALEFYKASLDIINLSEKGILKNFGLKTVPLGWKGRTLKNLGDFYTKSDQGQQAIDSYQQALKIYHQVEDEAGIGTTLSAVGTFFLKSGDFIQAEQNLLSAIKVWESIRTGLTDENKVSIADLQATTYRLLQQTLITQGKQESALEIAERGRARAFVELLTQRLSPQSTTEAASISPLSIQDIRQIAREQSTTLVEYSIIPEKAEIYVWVIKPTGEVAARQISLNSVKTSLDNLVINSRRSIGVRSGSISIEPTNEAEQTTQLKQLYQLLIEPISDLLPASTDASTTFLPQGALYLVPFPALQDKNNHFLIEKFRVLTAPAIQVLQLTQQQLRHAQKAGLQDTVVMGNPTMPSVSPKPGDPVKPLPSLPGSEKEAIEIADLLKTKPLIGNEANKKTVLQRILDAKLIHLATHGLLDDIGGGGSPGAIALAPDGTGEPNDGLLTANEILNLKLGAELVVLSACDTGRGRITGDGVIGLSRSLMSAGVPSIIVSLWSVPDAPTAELMVEFYRNWQGKKMDKAQALRQAMLTTMKTHPNPRDWAAFTLIGEAE